VFILLSYSVLDFAKLRRVFASDWRDIANKNQPTIAHTTQRTSLFPNLPTNRGTRTKETIDD